MYFDNGRYDAGYPEKVRKIAKTDAMNKIIHTAVELYFVLGIYARLLHCYIVTFRCA